MRLSGVTRALAVIAGLLALAAVPGAAHPGFGMDGGHGIGAMHAGMHPGFHTVGGTHTMHANWGGHMGGWGHGGWGQHNWNQNWNWNRNVNRNIDVNRNINRNVNRNFAHWAHGRWHGLHRWRDGFGRWHWGGAVLGFEMPLGYYGGAYGGGGGYADDDYRMDSDYGDLPYGQDYGDDEAYSGDEAAAYDDRGDCPCACGGDNMYGDGEDGCD
ncbi:MAG TPA: hypothetical protein VLC74_04465 [Rhizomicrobium sp.]|nr:hypothetical protein [Rhizomicrobium sp.]